MTVNQHEGTYRAATGMTYKCKIAWLYVRLDCWSNPMIYLIYYFYLFIFLITITVLGHFIQVVSGCLWLLDSTRMEQVSVRTRIHMIHTPKESTDPLKINAAIKCCLSNKKAIAQRWKQTPSQLLFFLKSWHDDYYVDHDFHLNVRSTFPAHGGEIKKNKTMQHGKSKWKWRPVEQTEL